MPVPVRFDKIVVGPLAVNCYVLYSRRGGGGLVLDPGDDVEVIQRVLRDLGLDLVGIYLTHAHVDHAGGAAQLSRLTGAPVFLHPGDAELLQVLPMQAQLFGLEKPEVPESVLPLADGDQIRLDDASLRVRHTPGHSEGSVCLLDSAGRQAWVGDLVFRNSVGRTDLPGGSTEKLLRSIREAVLTLGDDWILHPGHGPDTTVGEERRNNRFLQEAVELP